VPAKISTPESLVRCCLSVHHESKRLYRCPFSSLGGTIHEPMTDLVHLMSKLVDSQGKILIPGIMDSVAPLTAEEKARYENLDFNITEFQAGLRSKNNIFDDEESIFLHREEGLDSTARADGLLIDLAGGDFQR
jgi:hypothetical protein